MPRKCPVTVPVLADEPRGSASGLGARQPRSRPTGRCLIPALGVLLLLASFAPAGAELPPSSFPDSLMPNQTGIAPEDFEDVFSQVVLSEYYTQAQLDQAALDLDEASSAEAAAQLMPESVAKDYPELMEFIETGTMPAPETIFAGQQVPPAPAAGAALLPGLPPPYGYYTVNPTNNWGMPNAPSGGCGPWFIRGSGAYFDFSRACRQHDIAYRWTPVSRLSVDNRFLDEMLYDCSLRGAVTRRLCGIRAGLYYAAVRLLGAPSYGNDPTSGYNQAGAPVVWTAPYTSCGDSTHVWIATDGFGNRVPSTQSLYFTGVVRQFSRIRFRLFDASGNLALEYMTHGARTNCVTHHEPEEFPAGLLADGVYTVRAMYTPWETEEVTEVDLGTIEIFTPTGSTSCNQYSHAWVAGTETPITAGTVIYPTGVVRQFTSAYFTFVNSSGAIAQQHTTQLSRSNCVIHHEPEAHSTAGWTPGLYDIFATYVEWETDATVTQWVGQVQILPGGGSGGGGGPGSCPFKDPTTCP
jgi:hypothetical protein